MLRPLTFLLWLGLASAQQGPRVLIVTDLEGVTGVNDPDEQLLPGQRRYLESKRILAAEVNAAIEGVLAAGAAEITVWDGHDGSRTLTVDELPRIARLIQGRPTPANYYFSPKLYDGVLFIGQHAMAGAPEAVLAHSQNFNMKRIAINGKAVGEIGQLAAIAGHFDIPVIMLSGDQAACDELRDLQPSARTVAVKRLIGLKSTNSLSLAEARIQIEKAARDAVAHIAEYKPWKIPGPTEMTMESHPQPPQQPTGRIVKYNGATVLDAFQAWLGKP